MARVFGVALCFVFLVWFSPVQAEVPQQLHYNGYLTNAAGEAVDCPDPIQCGDGFDFTFRLYQSADSGDPIWEESLDSVAIYMGSFHAQLGNVNPISADVLNGSLWLAVKVNDQGEMAPRQAITSAPFAVRAGHAEQAEVALNADQLGGVNATEYALSADMPTVDNDTLGTMTCAVGMVPKATATGWVCDLDQTGGVDTTLSDEEVLLIVTGAGHVAGPHTVDTTLSDEQVVGIVTGAGHVAGPHTVDTTLSDEQVLGIVTGAGHVAGPHTTNTDALNALSCEAGQVAQWDGSAWVCATLDSDTLATSPPKPCGPDAVGSMYFDPVDNTFKICDGTEYLGVKFCKNECPLESTVACGAAIEDDCGNPCDTTGTGLNVAQCDADSTVQCGSVIYDDCSNPCGYSGTSLNTDQCDATTTTCAQTVTDNCSNDCGATGTLCPVGFCNGTSCVNTPVCNGGSTIASSPDQKIVMCQNNSSCEQDKASDCPTGFHLCTFKEWNLYNDGWSASFGISVGAIYCRGSGGAGHFTIDVGSADDDFNCWYGSSSPWCTSGYGCNEQSANAACCVDNPNCGNGALETTLEECDDGNTSDGDGCDNDCKTTTGEGC
jgi:cysteine-rich repeat protein